MTNTDPSTVVVVVGEEPEDAAVAALDLAQDESRRRPVTIVDLIGDAPSLRGIATTDDPHGVADCFEYGLSFAAVLRPTTVSPAISVIGSGTMPIPYDRALVSPRWDRIIDDARNQGGLIVFAVLTGTPGLRALVARADSIVRARSDVPAVGAIDDGRRPRTDTLPFRARSTQRAATPAEPPASMSRSLTTGLTAAAAVILVAVGWWLTGRPGTDGSTGSPVAVAAGVNSAHTDTTTSTAQLAPTAAGANVASNGGTATAALANGAAPSEAPGRVANPADSATAAVYAVRVGSYTNYADALRALRHHEGDWQAMTIVPLGASAGAPGQYLLITGAAQTRGALDSAVVRWTPRPDYRESAVLRTPYALRVTTSLPPEVARRTAARMLARGIPVYELVEDSGRESIYAGAFDSIDAAAPLAASLRTAGFTTVVAYRTGRMP